METDTTGELEIWEDLMKRAEKRFGKARSEELRIDLENVVSELSSVAAYKISVDDDPGGGEQ